MKKYRRLLKSLIFIIATLIYPLTSEAAFQPTDIMIGNVNDEPTPSTLQICSTSDGYVYAVWENLWSTLFPETYHYNIYFNYSSDYGANWQATSIQIDTSGINNYHYEPKISCTENGHVYVVWWEAEWCEDFYVMYVHSPDHGQTWDSVKGVGGYTLFGCLDDGELSPEIGSTEDGYVYVVWKDQRNYNPGLYPDAFFNYSNDYGSTWFGSQQLNSISNPSSVSISNDQNGNVYVAWVDEWGGIFSNYSNDYGATWQTTETEIYGGASPYVSLSCTEDGYVYAAWHIYGPLDIYFNYSSDYGVTWRASNIRLDTGDLPGASPSYLSKISNTSDGHVYVFWTDYRDTKGDIYFNYSSDYGSTWQTPDIRIDIGDLPGENESRYPNISNDDLGNIYIAFFDKRYGGWDVLFNSSNDYGATWQAAPERVNTGSPVGSGSASYPKISSDSNGNIYVAWHDNRNFRDNYFNYFSPAFPDTTPPYVSITSPTTDSTYLTTNSSITLSGMASDNVGVTQVTWSNAATGGSGSCSDTTSWTCSAISLNLGDNLITVNAEDAVSNSWTDQITVTYDFCSQVSSAPTGLVATAGLNSIFLTWDAVFPPGVCNIIEYKIYRDGLYYDTVTGSQTNYTDNSVTCDGSTNYTYQVSAADEFGEGTKSNSDTSTCGCSQVPSAPTGLTATGDSGSIILTWNAVNPPALCTITGYKIYRNGIYYGPVTGSQTNYTDNSVTCDGSTSYTYQVSEVDEVGEGVKSNESSTFCGTSPLLTPTDSGGGGCGCKIATEPLTAVSLLQVIITYFLYSIILWPLIIYRRWLRKHQNI